LASAAEFLKRQRAGEFAAMAGSAASAGHDWTTRGMGDTSARVDVAKILESWADYVDAGLADAQPFEVRARYEAATDLMEQVQGLLDDAQVHPAAPVVLAGAALEEALRALMASCDEQIDGTPSIAKYAAALRKCELLTRQDAKDITAWAGLRNAAAHGTFDDVSRDGARLMVAGVNLFLRQRTGGREASSGDG
jgi:hypothetical protein